MQIMKHLGIFKLKTIIFALVSLSKTKKSVCGSIDFFLIIIN